MDSKWEFGDLMNYIGNFENRQECTYLNRFFFVNEHVFYIFLCMPRKPIVPHKDKIVLHGTKRFTLKFHFINFLTHTKFYSISVRIFFRYYI